MHWTCKLCLTCSLLGAYTHHTFVIWTSTGPSMLPFAAGLTLIYPYPSLPAGLCSVLCCTLADISAGAAAASLSLLRTLYAYNRIIALAWDSRNQCIGRLGPASQIRSRGLSQLTTFFKAIGPDALAKPSVNRKGCCEVIVFLQHCMTERLRGCGCHNDCWPPCRNCINVIYLDV